MRGERVVLLAAMVVLLLVASPVRADGERLVLALYYPWYNLDTWSDPALSDRPAQLYDGSDPSAIARHVGWAREAGIDVLVSAWFGPAGDNPTEANFRKLLQSSARAGTRAALMLETDSDAFFPSIESQRAAISHALTVHARHPAYFRHQGKPVLFFWRPRAIWLGERRGGRDSAATVEAWRQLRDTLDPQRASVWIAEGEYVGYLDVFDGLFPYSIAWARDPAGRLARYGQAVRDYSASTGEYKLWIATAMPGYDDTGLLERPDRFAVDRRGGEYYRETFEGAMASDPDWINISSFNEWVEGHQIEPSVTYGHLYLDLTRELVLSWKKGPRASPDPIWEDTPAEGPAVEQAGVPEANNE